MTVYASDTFTRADGALGGSWVPRGESPEFWGIGTGTAYLYQGSTGGENWTYLESGAADCTITCDVDLSKSNEFVFRVLDVNNWNLVHCGGGSIYWYTIAAGTYAQVGSTVTGLTASGAHQFGLVLSGTTWTAYIDGVQVDQKTGQTNTQSATKHGLRCATAADYLNLNAGAAFYDNFLVNDQPIIPPSTRPIAIRSRF